MEVRAGITAKNAQESYHDAVFYRDEVRSMFTQGAVALRDRALAERIFWSIINKIADEMLGTPEPDEGQDLEG